jgi:hypothetical protein
MDSVARMSKLEIQEFMNRSESETDDSNRCRTIIGQLLNDREENLYLQFGEGKILILTTLDNKMILSKRNGQGVIGKKGPISEGDNYTPSGSDVVMKFSNIESLRVFKDGINDIESQMLSSLKYNPQ